MPFRTITCNGKMEIIPVLRRLPMILKNFKFIETSHVIPIDDAMVVPFLQAAKTKSLRKCYHNC